jgi:hypothetical protein
LPVRAASISARRCFSCARRGRAAARRQRWRAWQSGTRRYLLIAHLLAQLLLLAQHLALLPRGLLLGGASLLKLRGCSLTRDRAGLPCGAHQLLAQDTALNLGLAHLLARLLLLEVELRVEQRARAAESGAAGPCASAAAGVSVAGRARQT